MAFDLQQAVDHLSNLFPAPWSGFVNIFITKPATKKDDWAIERVIPLSNIGELELANQQALNILVGSGHNFYFCCALMDNTGKRKKANVHGFHFLWADKDDIDEKQCNDILEACPIAPSAVVKSGGGYHYYWCLNRFHSLEELGDVERANKVVASWVKGDFVQDAARLFRLPGTVCHKPWKYQTPLNCHIVTWNKERKYDIEQFFNIRMTAGQINLAADLVDKYIVKGEAIGDNSDRSTRDFAIMKELIRAKHTKEQIKDIFTNPAFKISEKNLERGNDDYFDRTYTNALATVGEMGAAIKDNGERVIKLVHVKGGGVEERIISNFVINPIHILNLPQDNEFYFHLEIKCSGLTKTFQANGRHLSGAKQFLSAVGFPGISWHGTDTDFMEYLDYVRRLLPPEKIYPSTQVIGWFQGGFITKDKVLGKEGIKFYDNGHAPSVVIRRVKEIDFGQWMNDLYLNLEKIAPSETSFFVWAWFAASLFAPFIRQGPRSMNQFPILCLAGEQSSGKTTLCNLFYRTLLGVQNSYSLKSTIASLRRTFTSSNAIPIFVDEYEADKAMMLDEVLRLCWQGGSQTIYDSQGYKNNTMPLLAPIVLCSATGISDTALRDRVVYIRVRKHLRPAGSKDALGWFVSQPMGYFARNWIRESKKEIVQCVNDCMEIAQMWLPEDNDRQIYSQAVCLGLLKYADRKYWNRIDFSKIRSWADPDEVKQEDKLDAHQIVDTIVSYMLRHPHEYGMVSGLRFKVDDEVLYLHQNHFYTMFPRCVNVLQLPTYVTARWMRSTIHDMHSKGSIRGFSKNSRLEGKAVSCIWINWRKFRDLSEELGFQGLVTLPDPLVREDEGDV